MALNGNLTPDIDTEVSLGTLVGRTSGESIQTRFQSDGWVMVQPNEEGAAVTRR